LAIKRRRSFSGTSSIVQPKSWTRPGTSYQKKSTSGLFSQRLVCSGADVTPFATFGVSICAWGTRLRLWLIFVSWFAPWSRRSTDARLRSNRTSNRPWASSPITCRSGWKYNRPQAEKNSKSNII
jgi:hypothetical protein